MLPDARLRVAALLNASAGTIERQGAGTLRDVLASAFEKHGIAAALEFLPGSELGSAAERARQQVVDGKLDAIVVGGGDGSVRTVASVLAGSNIPLGILPLGTLNHFARDLGISVVAERAVAIIGAGSGPGARAKKAKETTVKVDSNDPGHASRASQPAPVPAYHPCRRDC